MARPWRHALRSSGGPPALRGAAVLVWLLVCPGIPDAAPAATPVSVQLSWYHQSTSAGLYAAADQGYFAAEGLAVTLLEGALGVSPTERVASGQARFGVDVADRVLIARARGSPVRAIAAVYRRSPVVFMALTGSGITRPRDFAGKTIRVTPEAVPTLHAMMRREGVARRDYTLVTLSSDVSRFASGSPPVWSVFINGMATEARRAGHGLNLIFPDDWGVHFYGLTLFTTDGMIASSPDTVTRLLRATLRGWVWASQNPERVGEAVRRRRPDASPAQETEGMLATLPLIHTGEDRVGWMKPGVWAGMARVLAGEGLVPAAFDPGLAYTLDFLERVHVAR